MGLYVSFTPSDLGLPTYLDADVMGEHAEVEVDYSSACDAFCEVFEDIATSLVPVDTGYLQSTISADNDGFQCEAEATAEYAQYVEYGTWKMIAQPYFEPALNEGLEAFIDEAQEAVNEAQEILEEICETIIAEAQLALGGGEEGGFMEDLLGMTAGMLALLVLFPLLVMLYGIFDTLFNINTTPNYSGDYGGGNSIQVIIT